MIGPLWRPIWAPLIDAASSKHGLPPGLLMAIVWQESNGGISPTTGRWSPAQLWRYEEHLWDDPHKMMAKPLRLVFPLPPGVAAETPSAVIHKKRVCSSWGLCQILYATACDFAFAGDPEALMVPSVNLDLGAKILRRFLDRRAGDLRLGLRLWNARPTYADEVNHKLELLRQPGA